MPNEQKPTDLNTYTIVPWLVVLGEDEINADCTNKLITSVFQIRIRSQATHRQSLGNPTYTYIHTIAPYSIDTA